jgi:flagellar motor switch protein FliN/FliY
MSTETTIEAPAITGSSPAPGAGGPAGGGAAGAEAGKGLSALELPEVKRAEAEAAARGDPGRNIELLKDVTLRVKVELGRGKMLLKDVLRLTEGSVVELEKMAGDPLEIYVNDRLVGRGEVLVLNENFCVRITQIFSPQDCLRVKP